MGRAERRANHEKREARLRRAWKAYHNHRSQEGVAIGWEHIFGYKPKWAVFSYQNGIECLEWQRWMWKDWEDYRAEIVVREAEREIREYASEKDGLPFPNQSNSRRITGR